MSLGPYCATVTHAHRLMRGKYYHYLLFLHLEIDALILNVGCLTKGYLFSLIIKLDCSRVQQVSSAVLYVLYFQCCLIYSFFLDVSLPAATMCTQQC